MLRNREVQLLILVMGIISLVAIIIGVLLSPTAAILTSITSVLLISCCLLFTRWRYKELEKLSGYLRQISSGDDRLDIRDNEEGELSILKNDIYKMTLMLSEQSSSLQNEKIKLMNAISDISHQLKTPLTSMTVMADLLSDHQLDEEKRKEFTENILIQLERMDWLVSALLKISKIDAGTVSFKKDTIPVSQLIQKATNPLLIPMDIKNQRLIIEGEEDAFFRGDLNWTAEALINMLKNAVEHTDEGGQITVSFSENTLFTEIRIADNGKGIPKKDLPFIFKRFYKGSNASDGSIGIGLAMAHTIITSQDGDLTVKSEEGKGTEFRLKFYKKII
ncbi:sensor histidine kinase [Evansella sp. AB-rgal1]|uniref:sensor histidine kinase n=1 Tax=Evansella sp. AB-rgal1 TaxID=3242696 RepID=UPI00359D9EB9